MTFPDAFAASGAAADVTLLSVVGGVEAGSCSVAGAIASSLRGREAKGVGPGATDDETKALEEENWMPP